jgi:hypothetical protein
MHPSRHRKRCPAVVLRARTPLASIQPSCHAAAGLLVTAGPAAALSGWRIPRRQVPGSPARPSRAATRVPRQASAESGYRRALSMSREEVNERVRVTARPGGRTATDPVCGAHNGRQGIDCELFLVGIRVFTHLIQFRFPGHVLGQHPESPRGSRISKFSCIKSCFKRAHFTLELTGRLVLMRI